MRHRRRRALLLAGACAAASAWCITATAADAAAGRAKAAPCTACHGPQGLSAVPDAPNLAGQPALYVAEQLRAYRSGARRHEVMTLMAKPLSDADIDNLAAWYASIRISATTP